MCTDQMCGKSRDEKGFFLRALRQREDERVGNTLKAESNILMSLARRPMENKQRNRELLEETVINNGGEVYELDEERKRNTRLGSISNRLK